MNIQSSIFKAYDIRGKYPKEINEEVAYYIARAYAQIVKKELKKNNLKIVVGRDIRLSSVSLLKNVIKGLFDEGVEIMNLGKAATPTFYFAVAKYKFDGGIIVSASHNPKEFNGFKLVRRQAIPFSKKTGITKILSIIKKNDFSKSSSKGKLKNLSNVVSEEVKNSLKQINLKNLKPLKIVVDSANSVGAIVFNELFKYLPGKLIKMNFKLDGNFPAHEADPMKNENNIALQKRVVSERADLGIALDGDSDRIFFVTNEGRIISPALVIAFLAKLYLQEKKGKVIIDVRPARIARETIEKEGGELVIMPVGSSLMKTMAVKLQAVFAGESSGHFFVPTGVGIFEEPLIVALKLMEQLSLSGKTSAEFFRPLEKYIFSGEINFKVSNKERILNKLKKKYNKNIENKIDGFSFEWPDWWFNVRVSNTEDTLRLNLEAINEEIMKNKIKEISTFIKKG